MFAVVATDLFLGRRDGGEALIQVRVHPQILPHVLAQVPFLDPDPRERGCEGLRRGVACADHGDSLVDRRRIGLRRRESLDFGEDQRPLDEPRERLRVRVAAFDCHEAKVARRAHVAEEDEVARDDGQNPIQYLSIRRRGQKHSHQPDGHLQSASCNVQLHAQNACPSEMCHAFKSSRRPGVISWRLILNPRSTRIGPIGDWNRNPNPAALRSRLRSRSVACLNTLPVSRKPTTPTLRISRYRSSAFRMTTPLPPTGNPSASITSGVPSRSSAKPRTVVSPPAKKRSLAGSCTPARSSVSSAAASGTCANVVASPSRTLPANTSLLVFGSMRNACAV